jgi:hypothetical protein
LPSFAGASVGALFEVPVATCHDFDHGTLAAKPNQVYARLRRKFIDHDVYPGVGSRKQHEVER